MLLYLHGAIKNAGDFLIRQRGLELLQHLLPQKEVRDQPRWERLSEAPHVEGIILGGGPALRQNLESVYPHLLGPGVAKPGPYTGLALGWAGKARFDTGSGYFDRASRAFLEIAAADGGVSVRDNISADLMRTEKIPHTMTGCVAWYDIPFIDAQLHMPERISKLAFTPPAQPEYWRQSLKLLRQTAKQFKEAEKICVFHRGIWANTHTGRREAARNAVTALAAKQAGYRVIDASYGTETLDEYRSCDLHVGYRVHAHLFCLAARRPSFLIEEDGRGEGQAVTLHPGLRFRARDSGLPSLLGARIDSELSSNLPNLKTATSVMQSTWSTMRGFIQEALPPSRSTT